MLRKTFTRLGLATDCDALCTLHPGKAVKMVRKAKSKRFDFPCDLTADHLTADQTAFPGRVALLPGKPNYRFGGIVVKVSAGPADQLTDGWLLHSSFPNLSGHSMIYRRGSSLMDTLCLEMTPLSRPYSQCKATGSRF